MVFSGNHEDLILEKPSDLTRMTVLGILLSVSGLDQREITVLELLASRKTTRGIADQLGISIRTVEDTIQRIYDKLDIHDRASLISFWVYLTNMVIDAWGLSFPRKI